MITVMLGCRSKDGGNDNSHLKDFLASLCNASSPDSYEVIIKFDDDDPALSTLINIVEAAKEKGREIIPRDAEEKGGFFPGQNIRYIVTPRGKGYGDLHKAYMDLLTIANPKTTMYWVLSDDVIILGAGWDLYLAMASKKYDDGMFVLCPCTMVNYHNMPDATALEICDNYPVWSADYVKTVGFGYTFFIDGWTNLVLRKLAVVHAIDRRVDVRQVNLFRRSGAQDTPGSERFEGIRKDTIKLMLSPQMQSILNAQVKAIAGHIHGHQ